MIACFCLLEDLGNGSPHEGRACGAAAEQAEDDAENKASAAQNESDRAVAEEGFSDDPRLRSACASPAKWLQWQKTRDEVCDRAGNEHCSDSSGVRVRYAV